jgi:hypothetical protein
VSIQRAGRYAATMPDSAMRVAVPVQPASPPSPEALDFVRFCYHRRRVSWPDLYDEMCAVAARATYRGWGYDELAQLGISFSLAAMPGLATLAQQVATEERMKRQPAVHVRVERAGEVADAPMPVTPSLSPAAG